MKMKKLAAACLAAALSLSLASCGGDTSWTYRSGEYTVTSGMYVGLSIDALNAAAAVEGYDSTKSPFDQDLEGSDGSKWVQAKANSLAKEYLAVENEFANRGLTLSEEDQVAIDQQVEFYWTTFGMGTIYEEEGCNETSFTNLMTNSYKRSLLFESIYGEGGEKEVPETELTDYFQENYAKGIYITLSLTDSEGNSLDLDEVKEDAQALADRINNGEDFETVKAEYLADPEDESSSEPSDTSVVFLKESTTSQPYSGILETAQGEAAVIEADSAVYVVTQLDPLSGDSFESYRSTILQALKGEEFEETVTDWVSALSIEENSAAISKHNPNHLKDLF